MTSGVLLPGSTIGVVGGGQLGRMLALEARRMGYRTAVLDPDAAAPAAQIADEHVPAPLDDPAGVLELARRSDVVTLEWENADVAALHALDGIVPLRPGTLVLEVAQNRIIEKAEARRLGLDTAEFRPVRSIREMREAVAELGVPCILKTATGGYDGKGQRVIVDADAADEAYRELAASGRELILEEAIDFVMEASVVCARGVDGSLTSYPVVENVHRNGILDMTIAPADVAEPVRRRAVEIGETLARGLGVVGLLAVELFVDRRGRVLVNEIAPRPHNSGHYTWEACSVSQFEQQLRAVCGLPLAEPVLLRPAAMANLLGEHVGTGRGLATVAEILRDPLLSIHLYGKAESRPGRKMGHLTVLADDASDARRRAADARARLEAGHRRVIEASGATDTDM